MTAPPPPSPRSRAALAAHGDGTFAFQAAAAHLHRWHDPALDDAVVAYADTGAAWVAVGDPLATAAERAAVAARFVAAAEHAGRRACFFGSEDPTHLGLDAVAIGRQPVWDPAAWPATLASRRGLREQLRRARAKGVRVRMASADELAPRRPLRRAAEAQLAAWLRSRPLEPMGFIVRLEPFVRRDERRYLVAERAGALVALLVMVPIPGRRGWLLADLIRDAAAPNGTSELLLDHALRTAADDGAAMVTWGLAPLDGDVAPALRVAAALGRGLYDFRGLAAFERGWRRRRGSRCGWCIPPPARPGGGPRRQPARLRRDLAAALRGAHAVAARARSLGLGAPLVAWTGLLAAAVATDHAALFGMSRAALGAWAVIDGAGRGAAPPPRAHRRCAPARGAGRRLAVVDAARGPLVASPRSASATASAPSPGCWRPPRRCSPRSGWSMPPPPSAARRRRRRRERAQRRAQRRPSAPSTTSNTTPSSARR
ncbi:MAG: phosphatidylglycerol lysyltransferase domain-containing protein [Kofleriaceae bacterium]